MNKSHSAEYWRGVLHGYHGSDFLRYDDIRAAITEAEAREAKQRGEDVEVLSKDLNSKNRHFQDDIRRG